MSRQHEHEIEIAAPPEAVWRALTESEQLAKWFCESATIEPRVGGTHHVIWGPGVEAKATIDAWEPGARLRLVSQTDDQMPLPQPLVEEFTIEVRGDSTVLRLVHSGFGDDPKWDQFYDGTDTGWEIAFAALRVIVERYLEQPMTIARFGGPVPKSPRAAWEAVLGSEVLNGETLTNAKAGDRYEITTALGDTWTGEVILHMIPDGENDVAALEITIDQLNGVFLVGLEVMGEGTYSGGGLALFGDAPDSGAIERYGSRVRAVLGLAG